jgi:hypothetical protein
LTCVEVPVAHEFARFGWEVPSPVSPEWPMAKIPTGCARSGVGSGVPVGATNAVGDRVAVAAATQVVEVGTPDEHDARSRRHVATAADRARHFLVTRG